MSSSIPESPEPMPDTASPRCLSGIYPHVTLCAFVTDLELQDCIVLHRSDKVRSAKNCWAIPTGLHEHGETVEEGIIRELEEELAIPNYGGISVRIQPDPIVVYENQVDGYHWDLIIRHATVNCFGLETVARNLEPDKHDVMLVMPIPVLLGACLANIEGKPLTYDGHTFDDFSGAAKPIADFIKKLYAANA